MIRSLLGLLLPLFLIGCSQDLHFQIHFDRAEGLTAGSPLVLGEEKIGEVSGVQPAPDRGVLVSVSIQREHAASATERARFYLGADPKDSTRKRIEIVQTEPGGKAIAEGAVVQGEEAEASGLFPFGTILKEFGGLLRDLRGQVERFSRDFEKLPDSEEAKNLQQEWRKLLDEISEAQGTAEESLKKEVLPRLQEEMEALRKKLEELQRTAPKQRKPLET